MGKRRDIIYVFMYVIIVRKIIEGASRSLSVSEPAVCQFIILRGLSLAKNICYRENLKLLLFSGYL